jgi:hypothetical protein
MFITSNSALSIYIFLDLAPRSIWRGVYCRQVGYPGDNKIFLYVCV